MSIISNSIYPPEIINIGGGFMTIFLIIVLIISWLLVDSIYRNEYILDILDTCSNPLLLIFIAIVIFKVILII